jgi:protein-L-isoaspartate(D-aspartate) O-methyltransferase
MNTDIAKRQMLHQQIRTWNVIDVDVLDAIESLSREDFVPPEYADVAYADTEIPLAHGRRMLAPMVEGRILQELSLGPDDAVLEIGTGSGYLTACLARLAGSVVSIDVHQDLLDSAGQQLEAVGIDNVTLLRMDATTDLPEGSYDAIVVTGSMPRVDQRLLDALRPGGRLFVVIGDEPPMSAMLITRGADGNWQETSLFETSLEPLVRGQRESSFRF